MNPDFQLFLGCLTVFLGVLAIGEKRIMVVKKDIKEWVVSQFSTNKDRSDLRVMVIKLETEIKHMSDLLKEIRISMKNKKEY